MISFPTVAGDALLLFCRYIAATHPFIGVQMAAIDQRWRNYLNYSGKTGVLVAAVVAGSPADPGCRAGRTAADAAGRDAAGSGNFPEFGGGRPRHAVACVHRTVGSVAHPVAGERRCLGAGQRRRERGFRARPVVAMQHPLDAGTSAQREHGRDAQ